MKTRNLSPQAMFEAIADEHKPAYAFAGKTRTDFEAWKAEAWPKVLATLGNWPERVPLNAEMTAEWEHDGLRKQRWLIDVGKYISAAFLVNIPLDLKEGEKRAAICCWHGHGKFGKEPVMGNDTCPEMKESIDFHNYNYGHQMAKKGFVTYAIDWMGGGERDDHNRPHSRWHEFGDDWCNVYYMHTTMLGTTSIAMNVAHGMAATDFACSLPFVDPDRLGVMGLSGGGTMTMWSGLCDQRFKAVEIMGYSDLFAVMGMREINYCGMQISPGLMALAELADLQGMIAPRPLLVDIGVYDSCFYLDNSMRCQRQVERIYAAAGIPEKLELDLFAGEHGWGGNKSEAFFKKYLG
jgi:hypothetical protein